MKEIEREIGPMPEVELIICTEQLQSSRFLNLCRIRQADELKKSILVVSFFDTLLSWESAANRLGFTNFKGTGSITYDPIDHLNCSMRACRYQIIGMRACVYEILRV